MSFEIGQPPNSAVHLGSYQLHRIFRSLSEESNVTLLWGDGEHVINEPLANRNRPFRLVVADFDTTIVLTEGPGRFFYERRNVLFEEAGIIGDRNAHNALQTLVWRWDTDFVISVRGMLNRITQGVDISGDPLEREIQKQLLQLSDSENITRWAKHTEKERGVEQVNDTAVIIAERLEQIGIEMLENNPERVHELAPFAPGVLELFRSLPSNVIIAIASGTRRKTILKILQAQAICGHNEVLDRVGNAIVGEGDTVHRKPEHKFYEEAMWSLFDYIEAEGKATLRGIQVADIVFLGDYVDRKLDVSPSRLHSAILITGDSKIVPGPLATAVLSIEYLLNQMDMPLNKITDSTLRRFWLTMHGYDRCPEEDARQDLFNFVPTRPKARGYLGQIARGALLASRYLDRKKPIRF